MEENTMMTKSSETINKFLLTIIPAKQVKPIIKEIISFQEKWGIKNDQHYHELTKGGHIIMNLLKFKFPINDIIYFLKEI